jgi:hypothetical protein
LLQLLETGVCPGGYERRQTLLGGGGEVG